MNFGIEAFTVKTNVSRETRARLEIYAALLVKWQKKINLVAASSLSDMWWRHFYDSAQLLDYIPDRKARIVDLGAGAGFPGLVLACMGCSAVTLVESDLRKTLFLKEVARQTGVEVTVLNSRIEDLALEADIITARALAPLDQLLDYARPLLSDKGKCLFLKGESSAQEITLAQKKHQFTAQNHISRTDEKARIVEICF